jgi:hypothetical protein
MKTDDEVRKDVEEALGWDPSLDASRVGVGTRVGVVTLSGCVAGPAEQWEAEQIAKRVAGVRAVVNELEVELPADRRRSDSEVGRAVETALEWDAVVPPRWPRSCKLAGGT